MPRICDIIKFTFYHFMEKFSLPLFIDKNNPLSNRCGVLAVENWSKHDPANSFDFATHFIHYLLIDEFCSKQPLFDLEVALLSITSEINWKFKIKVLILDLNKTLFRFQVRTHSTPNTTDYTSHRFRLNFRNVNLLVWR